MIGIRDSGWEGLEGMGEEALRELRGTAERSVLSAALYFVGQLKKTLTGRRSGRTYRVSRTGALHVASAPGEPPAVLFGALRNSIGHTNPKWEGWAVSSEVGTGLGIGGGSDPSNAYARRLEFGGIDSRGVYIAPRPYMAPTEERVRPVIERRWESELS